MGIELVWLFLIICGGFGVGMAATTVLIEYYSVHVQRYNRDVGKHTSWLLRAGMQESFFIIRERYKKGF